VEESERETGGLGGVFRRGKRGRYLAEHPLLRKRDHRRALAHFSGGNKEGLPTPLNVN